MHKNSIIILLTLLLLCSCSNEVSENTASENGDKIWGDNKTSSTYASEIEPKNDYEYLGEADGIKLYKKK